MKDKNICISLVAQSLSYRGMKMIKNIINVLSTIQILPEHLFIWNIPHALITNIKAILNKIIFRVCKNVCFGFPFTEDFTTFFQLVKILLT